MSCGTQRNRCRICGGRDGGQYGSARRSPAIRNILIGGFSHIPGAFAALARSRRGRAGGTVGLIAQHPSEFAAARHCGWSRPARRMCTGCRDNRCWSSR
jgi:hypothetical protein